MRKLLIMAVLAALGSGVTGAVAATDGQDRWCTASQIRKAERQIERMDSVAERTKADMYLTMSKVARDNDDRQACIRHMKAVREVIER